MVKKILLILSLGVAWCLPAYDYAGGINVRDFGAVGDGVADDTPAIQKAISFAASLSHNELLARQPMLTGAPELGDLPILGMTGENVVVPEIFFPAGVYRLTGTLCGNNGVILRGEGDATLTTDVAGLDMIYFDWGFRVQIRGLNFEGGRRQIVFYTGNNDTANFTIENCRFRGSSGPAVWSHNPLRPGGHDFATMTIGPYVVDRSGELPVLTVNDVDSLPYYANSTNFTIRDSRFEGCYRALDLDGDGVNVADCTIIPGTDSAPETMLVSGAVRLIRLKGQAEASSSAKFWVRGAGNYVILDSDFHRSGGEGMPLMYWISKERPECTTTLMAKDIRINSGGALVFIANGENECTPNYLELSGIRETSGKRVHALGWEKMPTEAGLAASEFNQQPAVDILDGAWITRWPFTITVADSPLLSLDNLPACLAKTIEPPLAPEVVAATAVRKSVVDRDALRHGFARTLRAVDYGVDLDCDSDDTAAMQRLLAAAADGLPARIELPPVLIRVSEALTLPPEVAFFSRGFTTIHQEDWKQPVFTGAGTRKFYAENLRWSSGRNAVDLTPEPETAAAIFFERCFFYQQLEAAVRVVAGTPDNRTEVLMDNNTFISPVQGVVTDARHCELDNFWVSTNARQDRTAFITNLGGDMRIESMLGVPMPMTDHRFNHLPVIPDWPFANELRWIDNHGRLDIRYCRFGGEYYGIPLVFNFSSDATLSMDGGATCFSHPDTEQCMLYFVKNPRVTLLRNLGWTFRWPDARTVKRPDSNKEKPVLFTRNFFFERDSFIPGN